MHKRARCVVGEVRPLIMISVIGSCTDQCETVDDMPKRRRQTSSWKRILTFRYAKATGTHTTSKVRDGLNTVLLGIFVRVISRRHGSVMSCAQRDAYLRGVLLYGLLCERGWGDSKTGISSPGK